MRGLFAGRPAQPVSVLRVVPPQDGGWSLMPMENLLRGLRNADGAVALELYGVDGAMHYGVRANNGASVGGMFSAYFPQAVVSARTMGETPGEVAESDAGDWLVLDEDEYALVQPLGLLRESYLPLRIFDDRTLQQAEMDPLAGVIGVLSGHSAQFAGSAGSDRMGLRLLLRAAPEDWSAAWQDRMQARRDGDDRQPRPGGGSANADSGPSTGLLLGGAFLGGIGLLNWLYWSSGNLPALFLVNAAALAAGGGGFYLWRRLFNRPRRPYLDEALIEDKLKSLGFRAELQVVRIYRHQADAALAQAAVDQVIDCLRSFDDPAGNAWAPGKPLRYDGVSVLRREYPAHPFVGGSRILDWLNPKRAGRTVLSAREAASVWHLPLGMSKMASMGRIASGALVPYLGDLASGNEDSGPVVGLAGDRPIRLPESALRKHAVILGRSGMGKSTLIKHIVDYKLRRKAAGRDHGAVVVDPHADLVREILELVPAEIADKVRLLDFGRLDRVPGINLVDPYLFPDRDRCVDTIINTVKHLWEHWGSRLEDLLKNSLLIVYEHNSHPDTRREEMLTMLDILGLLEDGVETGQGRSVRTEMSPFQRRALSRVRDPRLKQWFRMYLGWPRETRAEAVGPVHSRIGAYAANQRSSVIMGQRQSTIMLSDVLAEGLVLLVSTAQGTVGKGPAALMGGTIVSLVESALRGQESLPPAQRARCLLVCDEFQTVTGADWEGLFAEIRKYGCSMMLATQSLARLDTNERRLKAGVLGNVGVIVGYQMAAEDARIISAEMDSNRVPEQFLVNLNPRDCCVRINSDTICYPAFSMKTLPPPDLSRGSPEAVSAVLEASLAYTVDYAAARRRMDQEVQQWLDSDSKLGAGSLTDADGGAAAAAPAAETLSGLYEQANREGADARPNRAARRARQRQEAGAAAAESPPPEAAAPPAAVPDSRLAPEVLEYIAKEGNRDPGLRQAMDKRLGNQVNRAWRQARAGAQSEADSRVEAEVAARLAAAREQAQAEALVTARRELAESLAGSDTGSDAAPGEGSSRRLDLLRRPGGGA